MENIISHIDAYNSHILKTVVTLIPLLIFRFIFIKSIKTFAVKFNFSKERIKVVVRIINLLLILFSVVIIVGIWGVERKEILFFVTSTVSVLGIAFFAQWSILSNITSGMVLFFNHPLKVGDKIKILEKDYEVCGKLTDVSIFFLHITTDDGYRITIPNSIALQKTILILTKDEELD